MTYVELTVTVLALAALIVGSFAFLRAEGKLDRNLLITVACLVTLFVIRWFLTTPTFVHANFHGPLLLNEPYRAPFGTFRNYGPFGSLIHGSVMRVVGANLTVVAATNQLFAVVTVGLMAHVARQWTGSWWAAACVGAVAALHPVLMRQGSSEDAHNLAIMLAWVAIVFAELYAQTGRRTALIACAAASILMLETRQIMFAFVPLFPLWIVMRARPGVLERRPVALAVAAMTAVLIMRIIVSVADPGQAAHIGSILFRLSSIEAMQLALTRHPILDLRFASHLLPFYVAGGLWLVRHSRAGRLFVVAVVGLFASSLWLFEGQNVALMFRAPVLTLGLFVAGLGVWWLVTWLCRVTRGRWAVGTVVAASALVPIALPGWQILTEIRPLTLEYRYIEVALSSLPRRMVLVTPDVRRPMPAYQFPVHLLHDAGITLEQPGSGMPEIFLRGVFCRAYSMAEVLGTAHGAYQMRNLAPAVWRDIFTAFESTAATAFDVPGERAECTRMVAGASPIGDPVRIEPLPQDPPFAIYGAGPIEVQFYRLRASGPGKR